MDSCSETGEDREEYAGIPASSAPKSSESARTNICLTPTQLDLLKSQMMAFKLLASNSPLPPLLYERFCLGPYGESILAAWQESQKEAFKSKRSAANISGDEPLQPNSAMALKILFSLLQTSTSEDLQEHELHPTQLNSLIFPYLSVSDPMDSSRLIIERERIVRSRVQNRISALSNLKLSLLDPKAHARATIELKALNLVDKQRKVNHVCLVLNS